MSNYKYIYWIGNDLDENNKNKEKIKDSFRYDNFEECDDVINAMNKIKILGFDFVFVIINCDLFENFVNRYNNEFTKGIKAIF